MGQIDWNKVFELIIPIVAVLVAGLIALYQMKQNIKLNAKVKLKEELRSVFKNYNLITGKMLDEYRFYMTLEDQEKYEFYKNTLTDLLIEIDSLEYDLTILLDKNKQLTDQIGEELDKLPRMLMTEELEETYVDDIIAQMNIINKLFKAYYDSI